MCQARFQASVTWFRPSQSLLSSGEDRYQTGNYKNGICRLVFAKGEGGGGQFDWEFGISRCKLLYRMGKQQAPTVEHKELYSISCDRTSLVAQWLRIHLPMQGTRVRALVQEDLTCCGATKPVYHNYWSLRSKAREPQLLSPRATTTEARAPIARAPQKRSHRNEKPMHHNEEWPLLAATKTQHSQK